MKKNTRIDTDSVDSKGVILSKASNSIIRAKMLLREGKVIEAFELLTTFGDYIFHQQNNK